MTRKDYMRYVDPSFEIRSDNPPSNNLLQLDFEANSKTPWKEDDRLWFEANKGRSFRLRHFVQAEDPLRLTNGTTHVLIRQITSGLREKRFLGGNFDYDAMPWDESLLLALWQIVFDLNCTSFTAKDVIELASLTLQSKSSINA